MRNLLEIRGYGPEGAYFEAKSAYEFDRKVEAWAKEYKSDTVPEILTTVGAEDAGQPTWTFKIRPYINLIYPSLSNGVHLGRALMFERRYCLNGERAACSVKSQHRKNRKVIEMIIRLLFTNQQIDHEYMSEYSSYLTEEERKFLFTCFLPKNCPTEEAL